MSLSMETASAHAPVERFLEWLRAEDASASSGEAITESAASSKSVKR